MTEGEWYKSDRGVLVAYIVAAILILVGAFMPRTETTTTVTLKRGEMICQPYEE